MAQSVCSWGVMNNHARRTTNATAMMIQWAEAVGSWRSWDAEERPAFSLQLKAEVRKGKRLQKAHSFLRFRNYSAAGGGRWQTPVLPRVPSDVKNSGCDGEDCHSQQWAVPHGAKSDSSLSSLWSLPSETLRPGILNWQPWNAKIQISSSFIRAFSLFSLKGWVSIFVVAVVGFIIL